MAPVATLPFKFTYVRIPADEGLPCEELSAEAKTYGDFLSDHLKEHFSGGSIKNAEGLRAEYGSAVDEKMEQLNLVAAQGNTEVFALVRPSVSTLPVPHSGTYFYLDEMGVLKDLPVNHRAIQIAKSCGLDVESPFLGDIFVGRVCVEPSPMHAVNFELKELDSGSIWIQSAPSENAQYQQAMHGYEKAAKAKNQQTKESMSNSGASGSSGEPGSYSWTQTPEDIEVTVSLPGGTAKKDVQVTLASKSIRVQLKGAAEPLVTLALFASIRPDESTWTFGGAKAGGSGMPSVAIMVEKGESVTWSRLEAASEGTLT
jgi:hypothetical protein